MKGRPAEETVRAESVTEERKEGKWKENDRRRATRRRRGNGNGKGVGERERHPSDPKTNLPNFSLIADRYNVATEERKQPKKRSGPRPISDEISKFERSYA